MALVHPKLPNVDSERGDSRLRVCQQRFRSVRFALYSAQQFAAALKSLLVGIVGDIDRRILGNGLRVDGVETRSAGIPSATTTAAPSRQARVDTRSRHGDASSPSGS